MVKLSDNIIQLGNRHFNYYIAGKEKAALIECGVTAGVAVFEEQWQKLPEKPCVRYIITLHAHFDHSCGIPSLRKIFPEAVVLGSQNARKFLAKPKLVADFLQQDRKMSEALRKRGLIVTLPESPQVEQITIDEIIGEGSSIVLSEGLTLEVMNSHGHSPCGLACYCPQEKVAFISDAAGFQISDDLLFPIFFNSYQAYIETIERLQAIPTGLLCFAHGKVLKGAEVERFYAQALNAARNLYDEIALNLKKGIDEQSLAQELFDRYYQGDIRLYTSENIMNCVEILIRRVRDVL